MSDIVIKRVEEDRYELYIGGEMVKDYEQSKMIHPWDWSQDALDNGASRRQIEQRQYEFIDERS